MMKALKGDLQFIVKNLKSLTRKAEKIAKEMDKLEKVKVRKKLKAKPRAKYARGKVARKTTRKTATATVLNIIKRRKKGVDISTLKDRTGFDEIKVRNIVSRAFRERKIKRAGRGIYISAK
jgi:hypothetical protein